MSITIEVSSQHGNLTCRAVHNSMKTTGFVLPLLLYSLGVGGTAIAQEQDSYTYATYFYCDVTQQERADEIVDQLDRPIYEAAVASGGITGLGWLIHHTGGKWRRLSYHNAPSIDALLAAQQKIGDEVEGKNKALDEEMGKICNSHDDYIWKRVAGNTGPRGKAGFSVYYVCDMTREDQADALIKRVFAPMYDKLVAEGKLTSWGWMEHIVGGEYRRLSTITAADMKSLLAARSSIIEALDKDPLDDTLTDICGSHADYVWEIKFEK
jgi:hypothetical protein